jgi:hypothetical protein
MYRRAPRSGFRRTRVTLGALRLDVGPHDAPDGTLTTCENVRPTGPADLPYYSPVVLPRRVTAALGTVCAIGMQELDQVKKLIVVTSTGVYLHEPITGTSQLVYSFSATDATRKAQFSTVGRRVYIAVSNGSSPEAPELLLLLDDTTCRRLYSPQLPAIEVTGATDISDGGLNPGATDMLYAYRFAYEFKDGTLGPPSTPSFFRLTTPVNDGWAIEWTLVDYPDTDNPIDSGYFDDEIVSIVLYLSEAIAFAGVDPIESMMNAVYYRVATWSAPADHTPGSSTIETRVTDAELVGGETLDIENLWQHDIMAAATFSYNQQLILGDVAYSFRKPNALMAFVDATADRALPGDYGVRLMVTIRTNTGEYSRISDPVYVPAAAAATAELRSLYSFPTTAWADNIFFYPDRRAVQIRIYVDDDDDGNYELLESHAMSAGSDIAYVFPGVIDLTTALTTAMPDEATTNATLDRDPNRMLVSGAFEPLYMPASSALYVSTSDADPIMAFAANTVPVSEGQYGDAPLLVLSRYNVKALELARSGDILFSRAVPLAERGAVSRYAVTNGDGIVFFASDDGVWPLSPRQGRTPLSAPVHGYESTADILDELDGSTVLQYHDDGRGNRDVWVSTSSQTWALSLAYGRWFTMDRLRSSLCRDGKSLYGYDTEAGEIVEEVQHANDGIAYDGRGTAVHFRIVTRPMTLGAEPGQIRRIYRLGLRQRVGLDYLNYAFFSPVGESELTEDSALALAATRTVPAGSRLVAVDSLTVNAGGSLVVYGDTYVVGSTEGAPVAAGEISADPSHVTGIATGLCRDVYAVIQGKGKMGQGLEAIEFDYEPRLPHRPRKRNF